MSDAPHTVSRRDFLRAGLGAAAWFTAAHQTLAADSRTPEARLNFVFILIDDLGWRDVSCFGSRYYETPNIDRLAREGMRFTNAYAACPVCSPTRAGILTGKYPARLHLTDWIPGNQPRHAKLRCPDWTKHLPLEEFTMAEAFRAAGYRTYFVGKWHLGGPDYYPEKQGFDVNIAGCFWGHPYRGYFSPYHIPTMKDGPKGEYLTDRLTDEALRLLDANGDSPFVLYLAHYAVHAPIQARQEMIERWRRKKPDDGQKNPAYAAMIESVDRSVGRILDKLEALGIAEHTAVIFMSDNGGLTPVTSNRPLRAGKGTPYEGGIREPLIIKWPGKTRPGSICDTPVISNDFYPTMLEMAGLPLRPRQHCDGVSLVPLLTGTGSLPRRDLFWHYPHYHRSPPFGAVRRGRWKLIEFYEDGRCELYDLANDIGETRDLAATHPDKVRELRTALHQWRKAVGAQMPTPNPDYDPNWRTKQQKQRKPLSPGKKDAEFTARINAAVDPHPLGYLLRTPETTPGAALRRISPPVTGPVRFTLSLQSVEGEWRNGFLAFGDAPDLDRLVKCGMYLGGRRLYTVIAGPFDAGRSVSLPLEGDPLRRFDLVVDVDPDAREVRMTVDGRTLRLKLDRPMPSIRYVGYAAVGTNTAFSPVRITPVQP